MNVGAKNGTALSWLAAFPREFQEPLAAGHQILAGATCEIRFRRGQPLTMAAPGRQLYWQKGRWQEAPFWGDWEETGEGLTADVLERLWQQLTGGSQYRLETELKNGYLTLAGGHRLGFCGRAVTEGGSIKSMRDISYLNLRLARQIKGSLDFCLPWLLQEGNWCSCLFVSPPLGGKTTLLRELVRLASRGISPQEAACLPQGAPGWPFNGQPVAGVNVSLVDERSELAGSWQGKRQFDLGPRTDVLDACPKAEGMLLLIRSMGPQILAADEIGKPEDLAALETALACGIKVFATVHGETPTELRRRPGWNRLLEEGYFDRLILLNRRDTGTGNEAGLKILDKAQQLLFQREKKKGGRQC